MTFGSVYAGVGGFDLAFERAGFEIRWQVEIDPFCQAVLAKHWPAVKRYADIRDLHAPEPAHVDWLGGGFPCQDLSSAGKRAGINGARSGLWRECVRLVDETRPRGVLLENVHHAWRQWVPVVRRALWELGYASLPLRVRASDFGAWHERARVFVVAHVDPSVLRLESWRQCWPFWPADPPLFADLNQSRQPGERGPAGRPRREEPTGEHGGARDAADARSSGRGTARPTWTEVGGQRSTVADVDALRELQPQGLERDESGRLVYGARWATEPDVVRVVHGVSSRLDRRRAAARIGALGNAVIPEEVEWIARQLIAAEEAGVSPTLR